VKEGAEMKRRTSVIIAARNEADRIGTLVRRLKNWWCCLEVIVVANGCTDNTAKRAKRAGAHVIEFEDALGPDVGRAVGLAAAKGDIYLVLDADLPVTPSQLLPFVRAVENGVDIALNHYPLLGTNRYQHPTAIAKHALNLFANRQDLAACSLTAVPHALSKKVVKGIGASVFGIPPVAQAVAMLQGTYRIEPVAHVPVGRMNPIRSMEHQRRMKKLIIGDCLEAIHLIHQQRGIRGGFTDLNRRRELIPEGSGSVPASTIAPPKAPLETLGPALGFHELAEGRGISIAAVVPAQDEQSLRDVVASLAKARFRQVVVVQNGSENRVDIPAEHATTLHFSESVGHDVGRAIGCANLYADRYLITDADIQIASADMRKFVDSLDSVDVALNHLDEILPKRLQTDGPSIVKRFLNLACDRPDLGVASLTAVPHALTRNVVDTIGFAALAVPPLAQVKAVLAGFTVRAVHPVDVVRKNAYRPDMHGSKSGRPVSKLIIGDCLEAIHYLQAQIGVRAYFPDDLRRRDILIQS
jgi:hypothetical protein